MFRKSWLGVSVFMLAFSFLVACGPAYQSDEANKLVNEANAMNTKRNESSAKSVDLFNELFGDKWVNAKDNQVYKTENKAKFDELVALREQTAKMDTEIGDKFETAQKLKLDDKFKEYLGMSVQVSRKRADASKMAAPFVKAFLEMKDPDKTNTLLDEYTKKSAAMVKEADDLEAKMEQFVKDNPQVFVK